MQIQLILRVPQEIISSNFNLYLITVNFEDQIAMLRRKTPVETDRKKKISLPAALFNRSPLKNTQNSSMISNTSFSNEPPCENHPNKKGKYTVITDQIQEDQQTFYCQKCAILLASKGFEVKKMEFSDITKTVQKKKVNPRQQELSNFLTAVSEKIKQLKQIKKQSAQQLTDIEQNYEDKIHRIQQFFEQLYLTLQKHKNKQFHELGLKKKSTQEQLTAHLAYVSEKIDLLETMKQDIESSHDSIVKDTPEEDYQLVMSHYHDNLSDTKVEPPQISLVDQSLPSVQTIQTLLAELFDNGRSGNNFSFDSTKKPYQ